MADQRYDVLVVGAGIAGLYQLHRLREQGFSVRVLEAGSDVGGTWYWNRYPGARFDSESYSYCYSFSDELLQEWDWSEHFAGQPEVHAYLRHVADRLELRRDITFDTRIIQATFDEATTEWVVRDQHEAEWRCRFLLCATGILSVPNYPKVPGIDEFGGQWCHTGLWPKEGIDFTGKRVGVVGTGASGIQTIQEVAKNAAELIVFQRGPHWAKPLRNALISADEQAEIKRTYPDIFARCAATEAGFLYQQDTRKTLDVPEREREAFLEELYARQGFAFWLSNFHDIFTDADANRLISDFLAKKIRERVHDPATAEALIPKDHGFGTKRVPMETHYYEVYNQPNVCLIDLKATPMTRVTASGIDLGTDHIDLDVIIYATGFDAVTGAIDRIDIEGVGGRSLKDAWRSGPRTFMGFQTVGFPNFFMVTGPHSSITFCNVPRCIEKNVEFLTDLLVEARRRGSSRVELTPGAESYWTNRVDNIAGELLMSKVDSWFTSKNADVEGGRPRGLLLYVGGAKDYRQHSDAVVTNGYREFAFT